MLQKMFFLRFVISLAYTAAVWSKSDIHQEAMRPLHVCLNIQNDVHMMMSLFLPGFSEAQLELE